MSLSFPTIDRKPACGFVPRAVANDARSSASAGQGEGRDAGAALNESSTLASNTGLNCINDELYTKIDYLTVIVPIADASTVYDLLEEIAKQYKDAIEYSWEQGQFIGRQFSNRAISAHGICAQWNLPGENGDEGSLRFTLSGGLLERCDVADTARLMHRLLYLYGAKFNRVDTTVDDYSRKMLPEYIREANQLKNYSGYRNGNFEYITDDNGDCYSAGWTIYLGNRLSDKFVRYYNAKPKHDIDAFRFEVEWKDEKAHYVAMAIANCNAKNNAKYNSSTIARKNVDESLARTISKIIVGAVSFIDKSSGDRFSRRELLPFWEDFVARMGGPGVKISPPTIKPTMERAIAWLEKSVAATLAMVSEFTGADKVAFIRHLASVGKERMSARHTSLLRAAKLEPSRQFPIENGYIYEMV